MKYYKLIKDNTIIGAISSNDFVYYSPITHSFKRTDETKGEYIDYQGQVYRTPWMRPIVEPRDYISVSVLEISEEEYNIYTEAITNNEEIVEEYQEEEPIIVDTFIDPIEAGSVVFVRDAKIKEMSAACRRTIENGFDLELRGETHHFSLSAQDQLNLMSASILMQTEQLIPYHADNEPQKFYTTAEMQLIINSANNHRNYHTTYYNALKAYINSLDSIEAIAAVTYGTPIPEAFQSEVWQVITY